MNTAIVILTLEVKQGTAWSERPSKAWYVFDFLNTSKYQAKRVKTFP